jgi:hypothetical protein
MEEELDLVEILLNRCLNMHGTPRKRVLLQSVV